MRINHNISALKANNQLAKTNSKLDTSLEKLSSGFRINSAADDSAGLAISQKMKTQISGLDQASRNASDGISVIQTAEGALVEVENMLQRMRELAVQSANGTYTTEDRAAIQSEIDQLNQEITRISQNTEFNSMRLLDGNIDRKSYSNNSSVALVALSDTVNVGEYGIKIVQDARQAVVVGKTTNFTGSPTSTAITADQKGTININGESVKINEGDTLAQVFEKVRNTCDTVDVNVFAVANGSTPSMSSHLDMAGYTSKDFAGQDQLVFMSRDYGSDQKVEIYCDNANLCDLLGITSKGAVVQGYDAKVELEVNKPDSNFTNTATLSVKGNKATISDRNGFSMVFEVEPGTRGSVYTDAEITSTSTLPTPGTFPTLPNYPTKAFTVGTATVHNLLVSADARQAVILGNTTQEASTAASVTPATGTITITKAGTNAGTYTVNVTAGQSFSTIYNNIQTALNPASCNVSAFLVDADAEDSPTGPAASAGYPTKTVAAYEGGDRLLFVSDEYGDSDSISVTCSNTALSNFLGLSTNTVTSTGIDAVVSKADPADLANITVAGNRVTDVTDSNTVTAPLVGTEFNDTTIVSTTAASAASIANYGIDVTVTVLDAGPMDIQIGANEGQTMSVRIPKVSPATLGIDKINIATADGAQEAVTLLDTAINTISTVRSKLGAYQNRLEHSISNLDTTSENMTESLSRIEDVDMAEEMASYTQKNVLAQAGTSMLAQANQRPQTILSLLQQ